MRRAAYAFPASHFAASGDKGADSPWMGLRVRLRGTFNCTALRPTARVVCVALQKYGGIFADNGSPWYFSGEATSRWDAVLDEIQDLKKIPGNQFDVVDPGGEACCARVSHAVRPRTTRQPTSATWRRHERRCGLGCAKRLAL